MAMRMAMALAEPSPPDIRLKEVAAWYKYFNQSKINAPTPNFNNLGNFEDRLRLLLPLQSQR